MFKRLLLLKQLPMSPDFGLLCLRVVCFLTMFVKNGAMKFVNFGVMSAHFPDPVHVGAIPSLVFAMLADSICSLLIIIGLATRWAALISFVNLLVAWTLVHHFALLGRGNDHEEMIVLYLGASLMLFFGGAGKYSVDALIERSCAKEEKPRTQSRMAQV